VPGITGAVATASNTRMELFYCKMKSVKSFNLFLGIEYYEGQSEDEIQPYIPEGWYYKCKTYEFKEGIDLSRNFGRNNNIFTNEINDYREAKNKVFVLSLLKKNNDRHLELLCPEISDWINKYSLSSLPNPQIQHRIKFCETILYDFQHWYEKNNFSVPEKCTHPILASVFAHETRKKKKSQRNKIRTYLKKNHPNFLNDPADQTNIATEFVEETYPYLYKKDKRDKIKSIRVELVGMQSNKISLEDEDTLNKK